MRIETANDLIKHHEGLRLKPYRCTADKLSVGYGRNLDDRGISQTEADFLLVNDIKSCLNDLKGNLSFWSGLSDVRKAVLIDMCFNLGWPRLSLFKHMLAALEKRDYVMASGEMLDSKWAKDVGLRAKRLSMMMESNEWPRA